MGARRTRCAVLGAAAFVMGTAASCELPFVPTFVVTTTVDAHDADPTDGVCESTPGAGDCTLRAAVEEANDDGRADITLPAGDYRITLMGSQPNAPTLDITGTILINHGASTAGVVIGREDFSFPGTPTPEGARVVIHEGGFLGLERVHTGRMRVAGGLVLNRGGISSTYDTSAGALDVLPTGTAVVVNSTISALAYLMSVDAITNAGDLTLAYSTVHVTLPGANSDAVATGGSGVTKATATAFTKLAEEPPRPPYPPSDFTTQPMGCSGTPVASNGYTFGLSSCGLAHPTDLVDVPYWPDSDGTVPLSWSPIRDAVPLGVADCGTVVTTDRQLDPRPNDSRGDGTPECDIGSREWP